MMKANRDKPGTVPLELAAGKHRTGKRICGLILRIAGILILIAVIGACLPLTVPKFMGYGIYHITSGSMEPTIPTGSIIYVEPENGSDVEEDEVIAYRADSSVIVHRVVQNKVVEGEFVTKGDANEAADFKPVEYDRLIGVVAYHIPKLGQILSRFESNSGKFGFVIAAVIGVLLNLIGGRMREKRR